jgi:hypothetical protein
MASAAWMLKKKKMVAAWVPAHGEALPVVVLVDVGVHGAPVQEAVRGGVEEVQHEEHEVERGGRVQGVQAAERLRHRVRVPDEVGQVLHEYPLVRGVYHQVHEADAVQPFEVDLLGLARRGVLARRQFGHFREANQELDQIVVESDGAADQHEAHQPVHHGEVPRIQVRQRGVEGERQLETARCVRRAVHLERRLTGCVVHVKAAFAGTGKSTKVDGATRTGSSRHRELGPRGPDQKVRRRIYKLFELGRQWRLLLLLTQTTSTAPFD